MKLICKLCGNQIGQVHARRYNANSYGLLKAIKGYFYCEKCHKLFKEGEYEVHL